MTRLFTAGSIVVHACVIAVIVGIQLVAVGPLPIPRRALAFEQLTEVKLVDVQLPAPPRQLSDSVAAPAVSMNAAPLDAPSGVRPESGLEGAATRSEPAVAIGVDGGVGGLNAVGTIEGVPAPATPAAPQPPVHLHQGIETPRKIVDVTPVYPTIARMSKIEGVVILETVIDARGLVESVKVLRSIPLLDKPAVDAVSRWRFTPARLNGEAIPVVMTVTVNFSLQNK